MSFLKIKSLCPSEADLREYERQGNACQLCGADVMAAVLLYDIDEVAQDPVRSLRQRLTRGISVKIACLAALAVKIACLAALAVSSYAAPQVLTVGKLLLPEKSSQWTSKTARARGEGGGGGGIRW